MKVSVDPNSAFTRAPQGRLVEACGIIPDFFIHAIREGADGTAREALKAMNDVYGFPVSPMPGGEVDQYGTYRFPEDPPLEPLMKLEAPGGVTLYIYQYAIVALVDPEETIVTRMD